MKSIYTLILALVAAATAIAAPPIRMVVNNGNWNIASSWDLNRTPQNGDTIVIPANLTVIIQNISLNLNSVLVRIYGTLNLNTNGKLDLDIVSRINVYVGGSIVGVGNNEQIRIGSNHVFKAGEPPVVGPMYANSTTGNGFMPMSTLPVTFANFYVSKLNGDIRIVWATATESNNNHFEIERSFDGREWSVIATVVGAGNTSSLTNYSYTDKNNKAAVSYYRIKQLDNDGRETYTAIRSIKNDDAASTTEIFAGSNKNITIKFDLVKTNVSVKIWNLNGQALMQQSYQHSAYISFKANNILPGVYVVQVTDENNRSESKKIVLN